MTVELVVSVVALVLAGASAVLTLLAFVMIGVLARRQPLAAESSNRPVFRAPTQVFTSAEVEDGR